MREIADWKTDVWVFLGGGVGWGGVGGAGCLVTVIFGRHVQSVRTLLSASGLQVPAMLEEWSLCTRAASHQTQMHTLLQL